MDKLATPGSGKFRIFIWIIVKYWLLLSKKEIAQFS